MKRFVAMLMLSAACANGQTATNRVAVDVANSVVSYRDFVADGDYTNSLRLWLPFLVAPTGATYSAGDCSRFRVTFNQTNSSARPAWTNGGMKFDGTNDLLQSSTLQTSAVGTVIARITPGSYAGATAHVIYAQGSLAAATNAFVFQVIDQVGAFGRTNIARAFGWVNSNSVNVEIAAQLPVASSTTMTLAWVNQTTNIAIYCNGVQLATFNTYGYTGQWWSVGQSVSTIGAIPRGGSSFFAPGTSQWLQLYDRALSSAEVYRVSTQGPTR